jgi:hypothetical protein
VRLLFWRKRGRHALGAAVTAIPSAPVRPVVPVPPAPVPVAEPVAEPDLMTSIAQLIATGEAWAEPGKSRARPGAAEPAGEVVPAAVVQEPVVQEPVVQEPVVQEPVVQALVLEAKPIAPPVPPAPAPLPAGLPRVQLGFRDGSSTALEPGSEQSLALEQLAQSLTRRD